MPEGYGIGQRGRSQSSSPGIRYHQRGFRTSQAGLAQLLAEKGVRANAVAPAPVWTPLIPSTMPVETVTHFGEQVPMKRPAQPPELASIYVRLASEEANYFSGATVAVAVANPLSSALTR
jgi:hypothetical protein